MQIVRVLTTNGRIFLVLVLVFEIQVTELLENFL